jgi:UDP-2-acetamido-2-deoxy-ribo-hexuluronate aminotransferase
MIRLQQKGYPKAIIPVSLFGCMYDWDAISSIANDYGMYVIEDGCHSLGSTQHFKRSLGTADISFTSFYPTKPFGCFGDGGMIFTNDGIAASVLRDMRSHNQSKKNYCESVGYNARLDTIQAAVLLEKFKTYKDDLKIRRSIAQKYTKELSDDYRFQIVSTDNSTWALFSIRHSNRDKLRVELKQNKIPTEVYYHYPLHKVPAFRGDLIKHEYKNAEEASKDIFQIPMNPYLSDSEVDKIIRVMREAVAP